MKLAVYLRVSTDRQAEEGLGLDTQEAACRKWLKANNHRIAVVLREEGVSGAKELEHRPALAEALAMIKDGRASGIVVNRLDRLARDLIIQESLLADVWRMGGEVFSTMGGEANLRDDPDDPSRKLIRQILGAIAEYDRAMIALRLRSGRRAKADRGGFAYGSPALGYKADRGELIPVDDEQAAVARIAELRRSGTSLRAICDILGAEGHRTKRGSGWHPQTVARVIRRPANK